MEKRMAMEDAKPLPQPNSKSSKPYALYVTYKTGWTDRPNSFKEYWCQTNSYRTLRGAQDAMKNLKEDQGYVKMLIVPNMHLDPRFRGEERNEFNKTYDAWGNDNLFKLFNERNNAKE